MHRDIERRRTRLDVVFTKVGSLTGDLELQAHFSRYLCVLVSGFLETSIRTILSQYASDKSAPNIARFVDGQLKSFQNPRMSNIVNLTRAFSEQWADQIDASTQGELKDAVDSIVANRHLIAHGEDVGISYVSVKDFYGRVVRVLEILDKHCNPH